MIVTKEGDFSAIEVALKMTVVVPCVLRAADFSDDRQILDQVIAGLRARWREEHTEKIMCQLNR
jgi:hypothetical protein